MFCKWAFVKNEVFLIPAFGIINRGGYYGYPVIAVAFAWLHWRFKIEIGVRRIRQSLNSEVEERADTLLKKSMCGKCRSNCKGEDDWCAAIYDVMDAPTEDVAEVKRGKWIVDDDGIVIYSECGARMDGERRNQNGEE